MYTVPKFKIKYALLSLLLLVCMEGFSINYSGVVKDKENGQPVGYAAVAVLGGTQGTMTDENGAFTLNVRRDSWIVISFIGYVSDTLRLGSNPYLDIELKPEPQMLQEVVVTRKRYRNKNNPAVDLIRKVNEHRKANQKQIALLTHTRQYEKTMFAVNDITEDLKKQRLLKSVDFIFENTDTALVKGKEILPFYLKEDVRDIYKRRDPEVKKVVTDGQQMVRVKGLQVDNDGLAQYLKYMYQDINIYDNTITFLTNGFLSPVATGAPQVYRYYIQDTVTIDTTQCVKLFFASRNKADLLFTGNLYISLDGDYAVKKVDMTIDGRINVNWVRGVQIVQEFDKTETQGWMLKRDYLLIDFYVNEAIPGIVGERLQVFKDSPIPAPSVPETAYDDLNAKEAKALHKAENRGGEKLANELTEGIPTMNASGYQERDEAYWIANRLEPLPKVQAQTYALMDSVQEVPMVKGAMTAGDIIGRGYIDLGKVEIGPVYGFYGYNAVEGHRVRFGGRTTNLLSKRVNFAGYVAYGFGDEKWKYYGKAAVSFTKKSVFDFPARTLSVSYYHDTHVPGRNVQVNENTLFQAIGRSENRMMYYDDCFTLSHLFEFSNHFSYDVGFKYFNVKPGGDMRFLMTRGDETTRASHDRLNLSEAFVTLRYAPNEKFYQGRASRHTVPSKYPIFTLSYGVGQTLWGNDYNYHRLVFTAQKRFNLSVLGLMDATLESGRVFGSTAFPALVTHQSNQSFLYLDAYNMMNYLEFVSSQYASLWLEYNAEGFFLNKIPLVRRMKLREVATLKFLWGEISKESSPTHHSDLPAMPVNSDGESMTHSMGKKPYIEGSIGVANLFKLLRVDFVKRFTYLDNPNAPSWGIRMKIDLDF